MGKGGDNRGQRAPVRQAAEEGLSAGDAGLSTGSHRRMEHGDTGGAEDEMHEDKGKS